MENILVINAGSSSLKYQLINMDDREVLAKGIAERIGMNGSKLTYKKGDVKIEKEAPMPTHDEAIQLMMSLLLDAENGVLASVDDITAVGHRAVQGGDVFNSSVLVTEDVINKIDELSALAPLHNPANIMGIRACQKVMPNTPQAVVFDTSFHQTIEPHAYIYGVPYEEYEEFRVRRYGFHGTSHSYVSKRMAEILGKNVEDMKIITCHLGNGSSITAVNKGKSVDTSMGFTPQEGLTMGTRCGDVDVAAITYIARKRNMNLDEIDNYINKKCGVLGISGVGSDFRDLNNAMNEGNERARLALETFSYRVKKYIGAYAAAMNGVDAIVFTGGVGENDEVVREWVMSDMEYLGVDLDKEANKNFKRGVEQPISTPTSKTPVWIVPTDEEMVIATETHALTR